MEGGHPLLDDTIVFGGTYHIWRAARIKAVLAHYGAAFFDGKSVAELGAGRGDIGNLFSLLGARVICVEGRADHCRVIADRYPHLEIIHQDLNQGIGLRKRVDVVIDWGLLYHLRDPGAHLRQALAACDTLLVESEVVDSAEIELRRNPNPSLHYDQSLDGVEYWPSVGWIEYVLRHHHRIVPAVADAGWHRYGWREHGEGGYALGQRRMWFVDAGYGRWRCCG